MLNIIVSFAEYFDLYTTLSRKRKKLESKKGWVEHKKVDLIKREYKKNKYNKTHKYTRLTMKQIRIYPRR